jgi:hypothetical protein
VRIGDRARALVELGDDSVKVVAGFRKGWEGLKPNLTDPVAVDRFVLACNTAAQALLQLAARAEQYAGDLLDGEDD